MIRILYINDDPAEALLEEAFEKLGITIELTVAEDVSNARKQLAQAEKFDTIFMDYELGGGQTAISSGLMRLALEKGFGAEKKPLIAYSQGYNSELLRDGCSHSCVWYNLDELVCQLFTI